MSGSEREWGEGGRRDGARWDANHGHGDGRQMPQIDALNSIPYFVLACANAYRVLTAFDEQVQSYPNAAYNQPASSFTMSGSSSMFLNTSHIWACKLSGEWNRLFSPRSTSR